MFGSNNGIGAHDNNNDADIGGGWANMDMFGGSS